MGGLARHRRQGPAEEARGEHVRQARPAPGGGGSPPGAGGADLPAPV